MGVIPLFGYALNIPVALAAQPQSLFLDQLVVPLVNLEELPQREPPRRPQVVGRQAENGQENDQQADPVIRKQADARFLVGGQVRLLLGGFVPNREVVLKEIMADQEEGEQDHENRTDETPAGLIAVVAFFAGEVGVAGPESAEPLPLPPTVVAA